MSFIDFFFNFMIYSSSDPLSAFVNSVVLSSPCVSCNNLPKESLSLRKNFLFLTRIQIAIMRKIIISAAPKIAGRRTRSSESYP